LASIDFTNSEEVAGRICAAFQPGVTEVIADLTTTTFRDSPAGRAPSGPAAHTHPFGDEDL
jgi:hypothetical protein